MDKGDAQRKRLWRDIRTILSVQVLSLIWTACFLMLFTGDVVPDYPDFDALHSLCGCGAIAGMIMFVITTCWNLLKFFVFILCHG